MLTSRLAGLEPPTSRLRVQRLTTELLRSVGLDYRTSVAQWPERRPGNPGGAGSEPSRGRICFLNLTTY
ncbi:hypothetical protein WDU94_001095 [Cyamophila willieti]